MILARWVPEAIRKRCYHYQTVIPIGVACGLASVVVLLRLPFRDDISVLEQPHEPEWTFAGLFVLAFVAMGVAVIYNEVMLRRPEFQRFFDGSGSE